MVVGKMSEITTYEKTKDSGIEWIGSIPSHWRVHTLYQLVIQVKEKNSNLQEKNLLSLSYGKIKRKDIDSPDGLLPASFDGYNIIEDGDIVLRLTDLQNDHTSLRVGLATERGIFPGIFDTTAQEAYMENTAAYEQLFLDVDKYQAVMRALADRLYKELHDDK